jgi:phosphatidylglycerophosphatase A
LKRFAVLLATWFGCGYFPWGPGTVGSLAAAVILFLVGKTIGFFRLTPLLLTAVLIVPAVWASTITARELRVPDPGVVVIDEVLGQWVSFLGAAVLNWKSLLIGFILFRVFDIWKPWPVRNFEKLPEGLGIVCDDLAAGVYGALILYLGGILRLY